MISRAALVGFGAVAERAHAPALAARGVALVAVADPSAARRAAAARAAPAARLYAGLAALLAAEKRLDVLVVCTPPSSHAADVLAGLRAGLHVLCEKPLTLDAASLAVIRAEAATRGRCAYSVDNWAYSPQWSRLLALASSGRLGTIRRAEIRVMRTRPAASALFGDWRRDSAIAGGGILVDHGWHALYLLRRMLGPRLRLSRAVLRPAGAVDEEASVLLDAPGASGAIRLSWRAADRSNAAFVSGEAGTAELRDDSLLVKTQGLEETFFFHEKLSAGSAHPGWLAAMWPAFEAECDGRGRGKSLDAVAFCAETIRAAYAASVPEADRA